MILKTNKNLNKFVKNNPFLVFLIGTLFSGLGIVIATSLLSSNEKQIYEDNGLDKNNIIIDLLVLDLQKEAVNYFNKKEYEKSIEIFKKILRKEPNNISALKYMALSFKNMNREKPAIVAINRAISLQSNNGNLYKIKCGIYGSFGEYKKAIKSCNKAYPIIKDKDKDAVLDYLSVFNRNINEYSLALRFRNIRMNKDPKVYLGRNYLGYDYFQRGVIYEKMEMNELAIIDYEKSLELSPFSGKYYRIAQERIKKIKKKNKM